MGDIYRSWGFPTTLLCVYGFLSSMKPIEPFIMIYMTGPDKNLTIEQVTNQIFPVWTYSYLVVLLPVFLLTDWLRYKPVIVIQCCALFLTTAVFLWLQSVRAMQATQILYSVVTSCDVAYFSYIYAVVHPNFYLKATSFCRSAQLLGYTLGSVTGQIVLSLQLMSYYYILVSTLVLISMSSVAALLLPMPSSSMFFHRKETREKKPGTTRNGGNVDVDVSASKQPDLQGSGADVKGSGADVQESGADVKGFGADVEKSGADVKGSGADVEESGADVKGSGADVEESGADVKGSGADVEESGADLKGFGADVKGSGADVEESGADVEESGADVKGFGADVERSGADVKGFGADVEESGADVKEPGYREALMKLWLDFRCCFSSTETLIWSVWWAAATCGYNQTVNYVQALWESVEPSKNGTQYNGAVEAVSNLFGAASAYGVGFSRVDWSRWGELALGSLSALSSAALYIMVFISNIWVCYGGYVVFKSLYMLLITIAMFQIAAGLSVERYALVFGVNTFVALVLQTILTAVVVDSRGLGLDIVTQFIIYASYFCLIALIFFVRGVHTLYLQKNTQREPDPNTHGDGGQTHTHSVKL